MYQKARNNLRKRDYEGISVVYPLRVDRIHFIQELERVFGLSYWQDASDWDHLNMPCIQIRGAQLVAVPPAEIDSAIEKQLCIKFDECVHYMDSLPSLPKLSKSNLKEVTNQFDTSQDFNSARDMI